MTRQSFRMAKASLRTREITTKAIPLRDDGRTAAEVLGEIRRLYQALEALPCTGKTQGRHAPDRVQSPAYLALERQIHALAIRFKTLDRAPLTLVRV